MQRSFTSVFILLLFSSVLTAQSTGQKVYQILQEKCATCHSNANPQSGLDLEGGGTSEFSRFLQVRNNLYNQIPANADAAESGDYYVYPGRPDRSFLFRKINGDFDAYYQLAAGEGQAMPPTDHPQLSDIEKEMIRQWILFGAKGTSDLVVEEDVIGYYEGNSMAAFPDGPPPAPAPGEGFQIKMGPFYVEPGGELEYFQRYHLDLPANVDVNRLEIMMGTFSHHFIIYNFNNGGESAVPHGLRLNSLHNDIGLVAAVQESTDLRLPEGSAFIWDNQLVLDLNSHYINYLPDHVYQAESYVNVYTQPAGTAAQEMKTELIANFDIPIPNNGDLITHRQHLNFPLGDVFLWGIMGHTHQYGMAYKVFERLPGGVEGDLIYDASCAQGVPGCIAPFFDYQHIPMRYFDPLLPITISPSRGLIHEAQWINDGPSPVNFGPTSDDEMMVIILMYTEDTTGIVSDLREIDRPASHVTAFPNPAGDHINFRLAEGRQWRSFRLFDAVGRVVARQRGDLSNQLTFNRNGLPQGVYLYQIEDEYGGLHTGRVVFE